MHYIGPLKWERWRPEVMPPSRRRQRRSAANELLPFVWLRVAHKLVKMTDTNENRLSYRTIANYFRQAVRQYLGSTGTPGISKVVKSSFGPAYTDQIANENAGMEASTEDDT
jgi:hypothetical protein